MRAGTAGGGIPGVTGLNWISFGGWRNLREDRQRLLRVFVVRVKLQRGAQLFLAVLPVAGPAVDQPEIPMKVSALCALAAELDGLFHLVHRLGPVLGIGSLDGEVPERLDAIEKALALFQFLRNAPCICSASGSWSLSSVRARLYSDCDWLGSTSTAAFQWAMASSVLPI